MMKTFKKFRKSLDDEELQKRSSKRTQKSKPKHQNDDDGEISEIESKYGLDVKRLVRD